MLTILIFFLVLSVLVIAHELGHFFAAKSVGVKPEEFGLGFPPRAVGYTKQNGEWQKVASTTMTSEKTIWSLNWLPLGGFVRLKGENEAMHEKDSFSSKGKLARAWILVGGVLMNWLLAFVIFTVGFLVGVPSALVELPPDAVVRDAHVEISSVVADSPAAKTGLAIGDRLIRVDSVEATDTEGVRATLGDHSATQEQLTLTISRDDVEQDIVVVPTEIASLGKKGIGVGLADVGTVRLPFFEAITTSAQTVWGYTKMIFTGFTDMIRRLFVERSAGADVSGPVGIAVMTGQVAKNGLWPLLHFAALLSINLAVLNLLPIPALDGGRLLFVLIEAVVGKRTANLEARVHQIGFVLLLGLILLVTIKDVHTYGAPLWHRIQNLLPF